VREVALEGKERASLLLLSGDISKDPMPQCGARAEFVFSVCRARKQHGCLLCLLS
jgi:hypothetical protein